MIKQYTQEDIDRLVKKLYDAPTLKLSDNEVKTLVNKYKKMYLEYGHNKDPNTINDKMVREFHSFMNYILNTNSLIFCNYKTWYDLFYDYNLNFYTYFYKKEYFKFLNDFDKEIGLRVKNAKTGRIDSIIIEDINVFTYADPRIIPLFKEFLKIVPEAKRNRS